MQLVAREVAVAAMLGWHRRWVGPWVEAGLRSPSHRSRGDPMAAELTLTRHHFGIVNRHTNPRGTRIMLTTTRARQDQQKQPPRSDGPPGDLITVTEAAKRLRLSRRTVERMVARGDLPFYELPIRGGLRFDINALEAWLARRHRSALEGR
jgi:excisionase family DNA binding protein